MSCVFSFYISEESIEIKELPRRYAFGKYTLQTNDSTPYMSACLDDRECSIFGLAINVASEDTDNPAEVIAKTCHDISDVLEYEKNLGGKYIILYRNGGQYYLLGDATCSIPVSYTVYGKFACSSNSQYIVKQYGYKPCEQLQKIRSSGDISQALPYDITVYKELKQLIPNHYLEIDTKSAVRFVNAEYAQNVLSVDEATQLVEPMIEKLYEYYHSLYKLYCPITSGRDSRVVLAYLMQDPKVQCYTIRHREHREEEQDIVIPKELCDRNYLSYEQIKDAVVSEKSKCEMDCLLGKGMYSMRTLQIAETIKEHYLDGAVINGDIIGQVGKCSLHRDISGAFAKPGYFRCKLHNYSREAKEELKLWLQEIDRSGECVNRFDLFSIENRMGRWAAQENLIYNSLGQIYLNIFNSRSIIYIWTAVSRKERKNSSLHIGLIERKSPGLLEIPFEADNSLAVRLAKKNGITYLLSTYAKYWSQSMKFKLGK